MRARGEASATRSAPSSLPKGARTVSAQTGPAHLPPSRPARCAPVAAKGRFAAMRRSAHANAATATAAALAVTSAATAEVDKALRISGTTWTPPAKQQSVRVRGACPSPEHSAVPVKSHRYSLPRRPKSEHPIHAMRAPRSAVALLVYSPPAPPGAAGSAKAPPPPVIELPRLPVLLLPRV